MVKEIREFEVEWGEVESMVSKLAKTQLWWPRCGNRPG